MVTGQPKRTRRGNNEGSIRFREAKNCWEAQVSIQGRRSTRTFKTRAEAQRWVREMQNSVECGLTALLARASLVDGLMEWVEMGKDAWQPETYRLYTHIINNHVLPHTKRALKIMEVKQYHIQELISIARQNKVGVRTQKYIVSTLQAFFNDLAFKQIFQHNPAEGIRINYKPPEMKTLSTQEIQQLFYAARDNRFEILYYMAIVTGMREGELLGLKWSDIDWNSQSLLIQRQVQWLNHSEDRSEPRYTFKSPKSKAGTRRIALGSVAIKKLKIQKDRIAMQRVVASDQWEEHDLVFPNLFGRPLEPTNLIREFKKLLDRAGLSPVRIHDLRHTSATLMLLMNVHPKIVSERLGHADIRITLQLYSHAIPTLQTEAAEKIDNLLNSEPTEPQKPGTTISDFEEALNYEDQ